MSKKENIVPPGLVYVRDDTPGITRKKKGRGFTYFDPGGNRITASDERKRIGELGIPPAWEDVWICVNPQGHLQATGYDNASRKQYRYHNKWTEYANKIKYDKLLDFGKYLPILRNRYEKDLKRKDWDKARVLALATALLDELYLRVGNQYYTEENSTYGLTTLRRKHLDFQGGVAHLDYTAKSGKKRSLDLDDGRLKKLLRECSELPGYEIFRYKVPNGFESISSTDLNEYLNLDAVDMHFSAKDFRTWGANCLCIQKAGDARKLVEENPRRKFESTLVGIVAEEMGNTPDICRKYYIHPEVLSAASNGKITYEGRDIEHRDRYDLSELRLLHILTD